MSQMYKYVANLASSLGELIPEISDREKVVELIEMDKELYSKLDFLTSKITPTESTDTEEAERAFIKAEKAVQVARSQPESLDLLIQTTREALTQVDRLTARSV